MRELFVLAKLFVVSSFGLSSFKSQLLKDKKQIWKPLVFLLAIVSFLPAYVGYIKLIQNVYIQLFTLGQESSIFTLAILPGSLMILFFGIVYAMSAFYFSRDIEQLIPLPVYENKIVIGKFLSMLVYEYLFVIPFLLPMLVIAGQDYAGFMYIIYSALMMLLLPIIPLGVSTILVMLLMKFTNIQGKKDLIRSISLFFMVFAILGIQTLITKTFSSIPMGGEGLFLSELLQKSDGLMSLIGKAYPPAIWFSKSLASATSLSGFAYMLINIVVSILMIEIIGYLGKSIYLKTLLEKNDFKRNTKTVNIGKVVMRRPQYLAIFMNDLRLVLRTPIFLFNCVSIAFLLPILIVVMPIVSGAGDEFNFSELYVTYGPYFNLILLAFFAFVASANPTASTTFSREGKSHWITNMIPVTPTNVFIGRILQPLLIELVSIVLMLSALKFILPLGFSSMIIALLFGMLVSTPIIAAGITIDTISPKLDWDEPQKAVKQNMNVILNMLIGIGYVLLLGYLGMKMMEFNISVNVIYAFVAAVSIIATGGIFLLFKTVAQR